MKKKLIVVLVLLSVLTGSVFSQEKYRPFDWLLGFGLGVGVGYDTDTWNESFNADPNGGTKVENLNIASTIDLGLNLDMYVFPWLSVSSGVSWRNAMFVNMDATAIKSQEDMWNIINNEPIISMLSIPLMAHINVPFLDFLYVGAGVTLNFPYESYSYNSVTKNVPSNLITDTDMYYSTPIDIGIDFIGDGGGSRIIFRIEPEFRKDATYVPVGIFWQLYNFRLFRGSTASQGRRDYSGYTEER